MIRKPSRPRDSVNLFLLRESYEGQDLFNLAKSDGWGAERGYSTLDKPYSQRIELIGNFWSGKHHRVVKELNLI